jgi:hypothetical protein
MQTIHSTSHSTNRRIAAVRKLISVLLGTFLLQATSFAQSPIVKISAAKSVQEAQSIADTTAPTERMRELKIPAGTALEIETANTVSSVNMRPHDFLSFRVLIPIKVDGVTLIDKGALVTGRVMESKRGGRWGKAGKLSWTMLDVVAVDLTRVPVRPHQELPGDGDRIRGISHGGEVAAKTVIMSAVFFPLAPLAVISGAFKRGEDAILPEGKRFVIYVQSDTLVRVAADPK